MHTESTFRAVGRTLFLQAIFYSYALAMLAGCAGIGNAEGAPGLGGGASTIKPDCSLEGELGIALGEGDTEFIPLVNGAAPTLYHGPQGGTHLLLASRISTPDPLDRYTVTVLAEVGNAECTTQPCPSYSKAGSIKTIVEGAPRARVSGENTADVLGLFVLVNGWLAGTEKRISMDIADDCDRQGSVVYEFSEGNEL